ncbi:MAG: hypothetical protein IT361_03110 [Gemmatimonadaceae bacterium]|nr:hypothetical protein [Gemmatimonadaceae bacterium]
MRIGSVVHALAILMTTSACPGIMSAQRARALVGASAYLTRDSGWNFDNNIAGSVGVERSSGRLGLRVLATLRYMPRAEGYAAVYPPYPQSARNGLSVGLHGLLLGPAGFYFLAGPERYTVAWEDGPAPPSGSTWVVVGGVGMRRGSWAVEGRYGSFARERGTTRGHLDVGIIWASGRGGA